MDSTPTSTTTPSSSTHASNSATNVTVPIATVAPLNLDTLIQSLPACQRCRDCRRGCDTLLPKCRSVFLYIIHLSIYTSISTSQCTCITPPMYIIPFNHTAPLLFPSSLQICTSVPTYISRDANHHPLIPIHRQCTKAGVECKYRDHGRDDFVSRRCAIHPPIHPQPFGCTAYPCRPSCS